MKRLIILCSIFFLGLSLSSITIPRVYVQKLTLENGKNPSITQEKDKSANEYILKAWINTRPDEIVSTETHPLYTIAVKQVGDGKKIPFYRYCQFAIGKFP